MRNVSQVKSVQDMRTTISAHVRATPPRKDSTYLDVYLLAKEKERLQTELGMLLKRQKRIEGRLEEIHEGMDKLLDKEEHDKKSLRIRDHPSDGPTGSDDSKWRNLAVGY